MPGENFLDSLQLILDELPDLPHLPELPARGPGADLTGRAVAHLVDLHADIQPAGWRLTDRPGADERRARALLAEDVDLLAAAAADYTGAFKVQVAGPWTLAATIELTRGDKALADPGAVRDLADSLAEGIRGQLVDLASRLPGAHLVCQLDEPALPAVLSGRVPTASGFGALPAVEAIRVEETFTRLVQAVTDAGATAIVHCCAARPPVSVLGAFTAVSLVVNDVHEDELGEYLDKGGRLIAGVVPALGPGVAPTVGSLVNPLRRLADRLGVSPDVLSVSPECGLAGASPGWARTALGLARRVGQAVAEAGA